ncbi:MAG: peptidase D-Ala-D-Ala carboxypeptidase, partial [Humibacillus sp.]|nr:peptidase D-Ala-D-Ala carboxypeptidase [Humibacillus sp.]
MPTDRDGRPRGISRPLAALLVAAALVPTYAALDAADVVPGLLTARPAPPPPPTETPGTRTLPVVPQPTPSTSVPDPLPPLAGAAKAATTSGVAGALAKVRRLPALTDAALVVRDGQTGAVLLDDGGSQLRIPASTTKLLSAAAVGRGFGPDATLETVVRQGAAPGEIVLVAGGDSLLAPGRGNPDGVAGRAGLADLADQAAAALTKVGTREVTLALDESYAYGPTVAPTWDPSFRPSGITGAVAMLGLSTQRAKGGRPGPADPVASVRDAFARLLTARGIAVSLAPRTTPTPTAATGAARPAPTP